jgi:hypothetical protein
MREFSYMVTVKVDEDDGAEFLGDQADPGTDLATEVGKRIESTMSGREWAETYSFDFTVDDVSPPPFPRRWQIYDADGGVSTVYHTDAEVMSELRGLDENTEVRVMWWTPAV